ncbi:zinc finger and BTB domain-containing protein 14-like isoform X2 [Topomyia yanbarensis]|nr:zinc finger and BTB domain-containing protein 14-like isoform X2 [Topomyia yanbarensis]
MTIFNLKSFPNVCRLCLQPKSSAEMVTLDSYRPLNGCTISEMLEEISFNVPFELACYMPMEVCERCLDVLEFFFKYKRKLDLIQHFASSLAEVKSGNQRPLRQLFENEEERLHMLFRDLDLCQQDVKADDLIGEFSEYDLASTVCIKVEDDNDGEYELAFTAELLGEGTTHCAEQDNDLPSFLGEFQRTVEEQSVEVKPVALPIESEKPTMQDFEEDLKSEYTVIEGAFDEYEEDNDCDLDNEGTSDGQQPSKKKRQLRLPEEEVSLQECNLDCKFSTTFPSQFEKHLTKMHADEIEMLTCHRRICSGELFSSVELLRQHKNDAHSTHICMLCGKVVKHLIALENHLKWHEREREPTLQCSLCEEMFRTQTEVEKHAVKVHSARISFDCHECGLGFKHKLLLSQHLLTHSVERNYNCEQCERSFKTANHLRRHIRTVHTEVRYTCDHCQMSYGRRDKLRMHMERAHDIQTYFVCEICCTSFETDDKLQEHKDRHENPNDLDCGICLISCTTADEFNEHLCITYQDDYVCCNRDFRYHSYYNRHMFLTHGINTNARVKPKTGVLMGKQRALRKPVERCTKCEQVFATRKLKKQHMDFCQGQVVIFEIEPVADGVVES